VLASVELRPRLGSYPQQPYGFMTEPTQQLSDDFCRAEATACREFAKSAALEPHRIMLEHIAGTWERIAGSLEVKGTA
jgi:hypothetical protein